MDRRGQVAAFEVCRASRTQESSKRCQRARWRSRVGLSKIGGAWIRLAFYETIRFKPGGVLMRSIVFLGMTLLAASVGIGQSHPSLPSSFRATTIHSPEGADIFVRSGGRGPVFVRLHGYAENSDSWAPLAADLMKDHSVVVPDLRGIGRSSKPESGYDKKTQAKDIRAVVTGLGYDKTSVVAHDIGNMVAYAYAATYPDKVQKLVVMDAPIPGIEPWNQIILNPKLWHFNFRGPDAERLVAGRERIYLDRIWNDFTGDPSKPDEATRNFFAATYAQPGEMRAGFAQFAAFSTDAADNKVFEQVKLTMPVLAVGGEKSFGALQAVIMRHVAINVQEAVVPRSGHWLMEESPVYTVNLVRQFLDSSAPAIPVHTTANKFDDGAKYPVFSANGSHGVFVLATVAQEPGCTREILAADR